MISQYGRQILEALNYLHSHKWYHMNLHTGNIILDHDSIKISELENFVNDLPIKNENYYNYVFTNFNNETFLKNDISVLSEIFSYNYNIFEKFDIISFGRVIYEMTFGKELKAPYPDDMEYNDIDNSIADILRLIFVKKYSKFNSNSTITLPDVSAGDLLKHKFFNNGFNESKLI